MLEAQHLAALVLAAVAAGRNLRDALDAQTVDTSLRPAVQALAYGALRWLGYLRFALRQLAPRKPKDPRIAALLHVALYQLEYTDAADYAVVDNAVENAARLDHPRVKPFVNAVLRSYLRRRDEIRQAAREDPQARYSYPAWWIERVRRDYGERAEAVLRAGNAHPPMTLRVNLRRISVCAYLARLAQSGLEARQVGASAILLAQPRPVSQVPGFDAGLVSVQDAGAQLAAPLLDLRAGQRVLDACAAPGGKSAHILESADVALLALDSEESRLARVRENLSRLGLAADTRCTDAGDLAGWWDGRPFDRVLLDVPCSASGVVRRQPDIKWLRRQTDIAGFARQQRRLLEAVWKVLGRGGKLLYVTCSVFSEENLHQVEQFLARHRDVRHADGTPGQLLPDDEHDGFYYALLEKV